MRGVRVKSGALIFLGTLCALALSWFGLVLLPHEQIGSQTPEKSDQLASLETRTNWLARQRGLPEKPGGSGAIYPSPRPGLAQLGAEIYRANGCAYCHTREVRQTGTTFDVVLLEAGTNGVEVLNAIQKLNRNSAGNNATKILGGLPKPLFRNVEKNFADTVQTTLNKLGAKAEVVLVPLGADIARGWGVRQTVAQDYLFDNPVSLGSQRVGPDLANVGARRDEDWNLLHLYNPRVEIKNSTMPPFRFLFEQRKIRGGKPSPDALQVDSVPAGFEIVPTTEAKALAAYLMSLRADAPLFETPMSAPKTPNTNTNVPVGESATNTPTNATAWTSNELNSIPVATNPNPK